MCPQNTKLAGFLKLPSVCYCIYGSVHGSNLVTDKLGQLQGKKLSIQQEITLWTQSCGLEAWSFSAKKNIILESHTVWTLSLISWLVCVWNVEQRKVRWTWRKHENVLSKEEGKASHCHVKTATTKPPSFIQWLSAAIIKKELFKTWHFLKFSSYFDYQLIVNISFLSKNQLVPVFQLLISLGCWLVWQNNSNMSTSLFSHSKLYWWN